MKTENKIVELNREIKAIKTAYEQVSTNLILYHYDVNVPLTPIGEYYFIEKEVTFTTANGANVIASIEGATYDRRPYNGGAKFYLFRKIGNINEPVKLHTIQEGTITIS